MKRRDFLKTTGIGMGSALILPTGLQPRNKSGKEDASPVTSYQVGDKIDREPFVYDSGMEKYKVLDLCLQAGAAINLLYIYGGGAMTHESRVGGIWCPDSFEDLHILRFIDYKYAASEVKIIPVACAPVYSSQYYGQEEDVFLDYPDNSQKYQEAVSSFIQSTEVAHANKFIPVQTYYDFRLRLLFNRREDLSPGDGYGPIHSWQGKFRGANETQKYGTPTIWLLDSHGVVLKDPFSGNLYHTDPFEIRYTVADVDHAIRDLL